MSQRGYSVDILRILLLFLFLVVVVVPRDIMMKSEKKERFRMRKRKEKRRVRWRNLLHLLQDFGYFHFESARLAKRINRDNIA